MEDDDLTAVAIAFLAVILLGFACASFLFYLLVIA